MRLQAVATGLAALAAGAVAASSDFRTANIYIQPVVHDAPAPELLAEIRYNPVGALSSKATWSDSDEQFGGADENEDDEDDQGTSAKVISYQAPDLPKTASSPLMLRVGVYDPSTGAWASSTSVTSAANFDKGYAPRFTLTVTSSPGEEAVVGASLRGVRIDAGQTRDFGPQASVHAADGPGKQVDLNRPVVLNAEGKRDAPPEEKSFIQKYWWIIAIGVVMSLSGGGGGEGGK